MTIKSLEVKNSNFFGEELHLNFSPKMNCIMGSRGTGKTTVISILYWVISQDEDLPKEMLSLIKSNLGSGTAEVVFENEHGDQFKVFKSFGDSPTVRDSSGAVVSFDQFLSRFGIDHFAAGAIEKIGLDPQHRLRLFDGFIGSEIQELNSEIHITVSQLKQNEIQIKTCRREMLKIKEDSQAFGNIDEEIKKVKSDLEAAEADAGLKAQFELENKKQTKRTLEQNYLAKVKEATQDILQQTERLRASGASALTLVSASSDLDSPTLRKFSELALERYRAATRLVDEFRKVVDSLSNELVGVSTLSKEENVQAEGEFSKLKQTIAKHRELFQRLNSLSQRATTKKIATEKDQALRTQEKTLKESREALLDKLNKLLVSRVETRRRHAEKVNSLMGQKVKILIREHALNEPFREILRANLAELQMRITGAERRILEVSNPQSLAASILKNEAETYAKRCEVLDVERIKNLFNTFKTSDIIYDLESCVCEDAPNFYLAVEDAKNVESFKPTEELSTGQRCTAVLPIIFAMTKKPLLIDQPEDNLDNKYITESIHEIIRKVKNERQLVFVTHNPNIPVISDSEFNTFLSYRDQRSFVLAVGDIQGVKTQIVDLLEGGKTAFIMRKEIYGY